MLEVGHITRPHGLAGEVVVKLVTTEVARVAPGLRRCSPANDHSWCARRDSSSSRRWVVVFEGVDTREAADELRGATLFAEPPSW